MGAIMAINSHVNSKAYGGWLPGVSDGVENTSKVNVALGREANTVNLNNNQGQQLVFDSNSSVLNLVSGRVFENYS